MFKIRPYQQKTFSRFMYYYENGFDEKQAKPYQLMFNMATGSGKTMIMAGLILYLYKQGYRKFLFFVNSTNIINKTIDNFINTHSSKYLFNNSGISFNGKRIKIRQIDNFKIITKIKDKFTNVSLKINKSNERATSQSEFISNKDWYAYDDNFGTSEEKKFVKMFARRIEKIEKTYNEVFLIRNERQLKVYDKKGRGFEPDFVLFLKQKNNPNITYQMFIEPKGIHLKKHDKWKEDFLVELRNSFENKILEYSSDKYKLTAVKFYSNEDENKFVKDLEEALFKEEM